LTPGGEGPTITPGGNETGRPIRALAGQERETSPDFMTKVRNRIYRRTAASQVASFSWHLPKTILMEMARMIAYLARVFAANKES